MLWLEVTYLTLLILLLNSLLNAFSPLYHHCHYFQASSVLSWVIAIASLLVYRFIIFSLQHCVFHPDVRVLKPLQHNFLFSSE